MKTIELKNIEKKEGSFAKSWKDLAIISVKNVNPQKTLNLEEMGSRLKVLDKINAAPHGAELQLEDAEFKTLHECASGVAWQIVDHDLFEFLSAVKKIAEA